MKRIIPLLISLFVVGLLVGCGGTITVEKKVPHYVWAVPNEKLIVNCPAEEPPAVPDVFAFLTPEDQVKMALDYANSLLGTIMICNKTIDGMREWREDKLKSEPPQTQ